MDEDLAVLRRLRDGGQLDNDDYEAPVDGEFDAPGGLDEFGSAADTPFVDEMTDHGSTEDEKQQAERLEPADISLRDDLTISYIASLAAISIVLGLASWAGLLSWLVSMGVALVLATTLIEGWKRVTLFGAVAVALLLIVSATTSTAAPSAESPPAAEPAADAPSESTDPAPSPAATVQQPEPVSAPSGSLDIQMDQVAALWNTVDGPQITTGLTRQSETGEYDSFIYRFGEWGRLLGAFDPDTETVYALVASGQFSNEATDELYVNLCYMVEEFNPECLESYQELGLGGAALEDFDGSTHEAEWTLGADTWRLHIEGNVLTIRVFGADAA